MKKTRQLPGVTILELVLYLTIAAVVSLAFFAFTNDSLGVLSNQRADGELQNQVHQSFRAINDLVREGAGARSTNNSVTDPNNSTGWSDQNTHPATLIIQSYATDTNNDFIIDETTFSPYKDNHIFFVDNGSLYHRVLANTDAMDNSANTTCPASSATASCRADPKLADNVTSFTTTYIGANNNVVALADDAAAIELRLVLEKTQFGRTIKVDQKTKVSFRNLR